MPKVFMFWTSSCFFMVSFCCSVECRCLLDGIDLRSIQPNMISFNSSLSACETGQQGFQGKKELCFMTMTMPDMTSTKKSFLDRFQTSKHFLLQGKGWHVANRFATPGVPPWPACWRAEFQRDDFGLWKGSRVAPCHGSNPPIGETWIRDQSGAT